MKCKKDEAVIHFRKNKMWERKYHQTVLGSAVDGIPILTVPRTTGGYLTPNGGVRQGGRRDRANCSSLRAGNRHVDYEFERKHKEIPFKRQKQQ